MVPDRTRISTRYITPGRGATASAAPSLTRTAVVDVIETAHSEVAAGRVRHAFECLDRVRGVGPKIASFFLRDVAVRFSIEPLRDRELLQPIDVWVRRYVTRLTGAAVPVGDLLAAQWICANAAAPEAANQGLWYFASQIASSEVKLGRALTDGEYARALVERYVDNLGDVVAAWRSPEKHEPGQPWRRPDRPHR